MKYNLHINQQQAIKLGIIDVKQALIFDLLSMSSTWAEPLNINGETYYWVARQKIIQELPLINLSPDRVYRHLKTLSKLGVIDYIKFGKKDLIKITKKGKKYHSSTMSVKIPNHYVGKNPEFNSVKIPTYTTTNIIHAKNLWDVYSKAYKTRYGSKPVQSSKIIKMLNSLDKEIGKKDTSHVIEHYLTMNDKYYLQNYHDVTTLLSKCQGIRTQWIKSLKLKKLASENK